MSHENFNPFASLEVLQINPFLKQGREFFRMGNFPLADHAHYVADFWKSEVNCE